MSEWIVIPNWDKFQHYKNRRPSWIKLYTELRDKDEWQALTLAQQGLLVNVWILYCTSDGLLKASSVPGQIPQKIRRRSLDALNDAGFITLSASKPLALRYQVASTEVEKEREDPSRTPSESSGRSSLEESQKPKGDPDELLRRAIDVAASWNGGPSELFDDKLDELERELHAQLSYSQRSQLWDRALARDKRTAF